MSEQEEIVRKVVDMWAGGLEPTIASWSDHATPDLIWWNNARGAVEGLDACLEAIRGFYATLDVSHVKVPIRLVVSDSDADVVVIERSDDTYLNDGTLLAAVPVIGVIHFRDGKIAEWRDYCDDWVAKLGQSVDATFTTA